jgi:hypothetical protein
MIPIIGDKTQERIQKLEEKSKLLEMLVVRTAETMTSVIKSMKKPDRFRFDKEMVKLIEEKKAKLAEFKVKLDTGEVKLKDD